MTLRAGAICGSVLVVCVSLGAASLPVFLVPKQKPINRWQLPE